MVSIEALLESLKLALQDHASKLVVGAILMGLGWYFGRWRAHGKWKKQEFFDRLNVSLNLIDDGVLQIRTLSEKHCADVFLNSVASDKVQKLARRTTATDPLLPLSKEDAWYYLNAVLNDLSEQFAVGSLRKDLGVPVHSAKYLVCLTCESAGELRTRKIRAMVIRKDLLVKLPTEPPKLLQSHHSTRWTTLQFMAAEYARNPWRFIEIELAA